MGGRSGLPKKPINDDDWDRIALCIRVLADSAPFISTFSGNNAASLCRRCWPPRRRRKKLRTKAARNLEARGRRISPPTPTIPSPSRNFSKLDLGGGTENLF